MESVLHFAGLALLLGFCLFALASLVLGLPGTFLILFAALIYGWATGFALIQWSTLGWLTLLAVVGEVLELLSSAGIGGDTSPSRREQIAAIAGAIVGSLLGAPLLLGLGALLGALLGAFAGASLAVASEGASRAEAIRSGWNALRGRFLGFVVKTAIAVAMIVILLAALF